MEYVREWATEAASVPAPRMDASSPWSEPLREDEMPGGDELSELWREGSDEASEASSRESRGGKGEMVLTFE